MISRDDYEEVLQMRRDLDALRADLMHTVRAYYARKYSPDQPRVPAGSREGGQWTDGGGGGGGINDSRVISDVTPDNDWRPGAQYAAGPRGPKDRLPLHVPLPGAGEGVSSTYRAGQVTIVNDAQTGISTVDDTTERLKTILEKVVNARPEGFGREYGSAIHYAFGDAVKEENLRGIGREGVDIRFQKIRAMVQKAQSAPTSL